MYPFNSQFASLIDKISWLQLTDTRLFWNQHGVPYIGGNGLKFPLFCKLDSMVVKYSRNHGPQSQNIRNIHKILSPTYLYLDSVR
ncbi:hypothetical protein CEXT_195491 [Caerostris extrusa]|uniref:Uncharacterized protein n=1 Tax=Caerostris extrusa TaxID=172846 RepID=A0AAV4R5J3_CAEEX|nr:hypothetical protein CEXT_195491 [Caerostris extrusa]